MASIHHRRPGVDVLAAATGEPATWLGDGIWMSPGASNSYAVETGSGRIIINTVYDWAGDELTDDTIQRMRRWLTEHPQDRFDSATYTLEQYGLTVDGIRPVCDKYLAAFDIELEGTA